MSITNKNSRSKRHIPLVHVTRGGVNLRRAAGYDYCLTWGELGDQHRMATEWIPHLSAKKWSSEEMIRELIAAWREHRQKNFKSKRVSK